MDSAIICYVMQWTLTLTATTLPFKTKTGQILNSKDSHCRGAGNARVMMSQSTKQWHLADYLSCWKCGGQEQTEITKANVC